MKNLRSRRWSQSKDAEINMSTLIDIVFILLIFFIVTTVFRNDPGVEVKVPSAISSDRMKQDAVMLAVTADGRVFHGGRNVGMEGVRPLIDSLLAEDKEMPVVIQSDEKAEHGVVLQVVDLARLAGAKQVFSATTK